MKNMSLPIAVVTGASGGIGGAITKKLVYLGYTVFAQFNNNSIDALINQLEKEGYSNRVIKLKFDLTLEQEISNAVNEVYKSAKKIDLLVNCAGVGLYKLATKTSSEEWQKVFDVNMTGAHLLTSKILDGMIDRKSGKIINISSIWGNVGASMEVCYSASKSAMIGYTKALAKEVAPSGITVNCVCPGVIDTPMNSRFSQEEMNALVDQTPLSRIGNPSDVAGLVGFLASHEADFITGQIITVDGGFTL